MPLLCRSPSPSELQRLPICPHVKRRWKWIGLVETPRVRIGPNQRVASCAGFLRNSSWPNLVPGYLDLRSLIRNFLKKEIGIVKWAGSTETVSPVEVAFQQPTKKREDQLHCFPGNLPGKQPCALDLLRVHAGSVFFCVNLWRWAAKSPKMGQSIYTSCVLSWKWVAWPVMMILFLYTNRWSSMSLLISGSVISSPGFALALLY